MPVGVSVHKIALLEFVRLKPRFTQPGVPPGNSPRS